MMKILFICSVFLFCLWDQIHSAPIIDIAPLVDDYQTDSNTLSEEAINTLKRIEEVAQTHGTFLVINHGLNPETIANSLEAAKSLFALPLEDKMKLTFNQTHNFCRGYLPYGAESGLSSFFEPKEGYSFGYPNENSNENFLSSPNRWPSTLSLETKDQIEQMYLHFSKIAHILMTSIIKYRESQGKPTPIVIEGGEKISLMRIFHYFALSNVNIDQSTTSALGSSPHTDWGLLTLILQNEITGLQYYHEDAWHDVPYVPQSIAINIGDFFSLMTNKEYHSPIHRVLCPKDINRMSYVYFLYPNYQSSLPQTSEETNVKSTIEFNTLTQLEGEGTVESTSSTSEKASPMNFGDYIIQKWLGVFRGK